MFEGISLSIVYTLVVFLGGFALFTKKFVEEVTQAPKPKLIRIKTN